MLYLLEGFNERRVMARVMTNFVKHGPREQLIGCHAFLLPHDFASTHPLADLSVCGEEQHLLTFHEFEQRAAMEPHERP
jgi:hypothetical protein